MSKSEFPELLSSSISKTSCPSALSPTRCGSRKPRNPTLASALSRRTRDCNSQAHRDSIALVQPDGTPLEYRTGCLGPDEATSADLLFDLRYDFPESLVKRFRRTALLDIDPGILQIAMKGKHINPAPHDIYFTIGETVGQTGSRFPSLGINWVHVPPCVSTETWRALPAPSNGAFTTVSHWYMREWMVDDDGSLYKNDKRSAYLPFMELPKRVSSPLELAIHLAGDTVEREILESQGWHVKEAHETCRLPEIHSILPPRIRLRETRVL